MRSLIMYVSLLALFSSSAWAGLITDPLAECNVYNESRLFTTIGGDDITSPLGVPGVEDIRVFSIPGALGADQCLALYSRGAPSNPGVVARDIWVFTIADAGKLNFSFLVGNVPDLTSGSPVPILDPFGQTLNLLVKEATATSFSSVTELFFNGIAADTPSASFSVNVGVGDTIRVRTSDFAGRPATDTVVALMRQDVTAVSEPSAVSLILLGIAGMAAGRKKRQTA